MKSSFPINQVQTLKLDSEILNFLATVCRLWRLYRVRIECCGNVVVKGEKLKIFMRRLVASFSVFALID